MTRVLILYYSSYGHVRSLAQAEAEGARSVPGIIVDIRRVPELVPDGVRQAEGYDDDPTPLAKPADLAVNGGCWFTGGGIAVHCGVEDGFLPARRAHPALLVSDLDALVERLENAGVMFKPGKPLKGYLRGDIVDPFGNRVELMQRV